MHLPSVRIPAKLRKRRGDGYESDAGHASDVKGKEKSGGKAGRKKAGRDEGSEAKNEEAHAEEEGKSAEKSEVERQRATSFTSRGSKKGTEAGESSSFHGYETDAPTRRSRFGKKKKQTTGYETDTSRVSSPGPGPKKSKSKFFKLGGKSFKSGSTKNWPPLGPKSGEGFGTTQLPTLPVLPSLDTSFADSILPHTSPVLPVSAPPTISNTPFPQAKSMDLKREVSSEKRIRDSHVSGESSRSSTSNVSNGPSRETRMPKHKGLRFFSSSKSSPASPSNKFPAISLPLGRRSVSPSPSEGTTNHHQHQVWPEALSPDSLRALSPSPQAGSGGPESRGQYTSPTLPALLSPTYLQGPISPTLLSPTSSSSVVASASAPSSPAISRAPSRRPRYSNLTVATNLTIPPSLTRLPTNGKGPSPIYPPEVVPSQSGTNTASVCSTSNGTLSYLTPNSLSYYDIPPPSPPPNAPLPKIPDVVGEDDPFGVNGSSIIRSLSPTDRSRDVPFLSRLRARAGSYQSVKNNDGAKGGLKVSKKRISDPRMIVNGAEHQRQSDSSRDTEPDGDGADGQEMQDVLDRFLETPNHRDEHEAEGRALGRSRSFEALPVEVVSPPVVPPPEAISRTDIESYVDEDESFYSREFSSKRRSTVYYSDHEDGADPRLSRWSGSIYSRGSFMDPQKSEETRNRFVKRVEAMLDEAGIERGNKRNWNAVPPVPKLPESLAQSNILTRQNQLRSAGVGESTWIQF